MAYSDQAISISDDTLSIRHYYLWGTKRVALSAIRSVTRVPLTPLRGKGRIWGTSNPRYWANLDTRRPSKELAFIVDAGKAVKPFVTPDDPEAFAAALVAAGVEITEGDGTGRYI